MVFNIKELVDFMSIGTLMAYTLVAASVMILRYRNDVQYDVQGFIWNKKSNLFTTTILGDDCIDAFEWSHLMKPVKSHPTTASARVVAINSTVLSKL